MKSTFIRKAFLAAAAVSVAGLGIVAPASAETRTAVVHYADLDLDSADGQTALAGRIKGAVRKVCGVANQHSPLDVADHKSCTTEANSSAKRATVTLLAAVKAGTASGSFGVAAD